MAIRAITFDFWNTLYSDQGLGFGGVTQARMAALRKALRSAGVDPSAAELEAAYAGGFQAYLEAWLAGRHFGADQQVRHVVAAFQAKVEVETLEATVAEVEAAGLGADLALLPGAAETLPRLAEAGIGLGLISDTGLTPGRILTTFLERDDVLPLFGALTFSDETGFPKPHAQMFLRTLAHLHTQPRNAAHVGDNPRTDIAGAKALGICAVRFAGERDQNEPPAADLVITDHRELLPLVGLAPA